MPPKGHRSGSTGRLGARTNSATKIAANLQFTQKDLPASKHPDKQKKSAGYASDKMPPARVNSSHRVHSKDHMPPLKRGTSAQKVHTYANANTSKGRAGFTIAKDEEDDDDEWVSSESGAATPLNHDSDSETASEADDAAQALYTQHLDSNLRATLPRVETARPNDFPPRIVREEVPAEPPSAQTPTTPQAPPFSQPTAPAPDTPKSDVSQLQSQLRRMELDTPKETRTDPPPQPQQQQQQPQPSPRHSYSGKRSRPPSMYSQSGKELRPHPLIRGLSAGNVSLGRGGGLAPLTVATGAAPPQLSTSPASSVHDVTTSPTSTAASFHDGPASYLQDRRASISSAKSFAPGQSLYPSSNTTLFDRARTLSLMSGSSSAALSALSHLPSVTRPPSPQAVVYFPPVNPHANVEAIHPLLPGPYLSNHLTVLARRNPLRESYDRVLRAKIEAQTSNAKLQ